MKICWSFSTWQLVFKRLLCNIIVFDQRGWQEVVFDRREYFSTEVYTMTLDTTPLRIFRGSLVPKNARLAGWAALIRAFNLRVPLRHGSCVSDQHVKDSRRNEGDWTVLDKRYWPGDTLADHLGFALSNEDLDVLIFKRLCDAAPANAFVEMVRSRPTGATARRIWFLYEHLQGRTLDLNDAETRLPAVSVLDPVDHFTGAPRLSRRHRVRDNLLGTGSFCPIIRRTQALSDFLRLNLSLSAHEIVGRTGERLISRAASFLLLADSRASFEIEGERPPRSRLESWGRAIMQAGKNPLGLDEILRLHDVLIEDKRFIHRGLRVDGVFIGDRDLADDPLPEFIGARSEDLDSLMSGLLAAHDRMRDDGIDAVLEAAATAFGFVYVHPFEDGNGRLHRYLIHHVLAERKFTPPGLVFPVSAVMRDREDEYKATLQAHSKPLLPFIEWRPTSKHNVEVLSDTADLYRYFDATADAEFLYSCVRRTVEHDLPREIEYLRRHDKAMRRVMEVVPLPDRIAQDLLRYIRENDGRLSKRRHEGEFKNLRDEEVAHIEELVNEAFEGFD